MRAVFTFITAALIAFASAASAAGGTASYAESRVADVRIEYPAEQPETLRDTLGINPGESYSIKRIGESIERLYLTGRFRDISVYAKDSPEGVVLTYVLVPRPWVYEIDVEGNDEVSSSSITSSMSIKERDFVDGKLIARSADNIRKLYKREGFGSTKVKIDELPVSPVRTTLEVDVQEGEPTVVRDVVFEGDTVLPRDELTDAMTLEPGDRLRREDLDTSVEDLLSLYVDKGYVNAEVVPRDTPLSGGPVDLVVDVKPGALLTVSFEGNEEFSDSELKEPLTFWKDRDASPENVSDNLDRLVEFYRDNGFYLAAVTSRTERTESPDAINVRYIIIEGPRSELERITFTGNETVDRDKLISVMELQESGWFTSTYVTDEKVKKDAERLGLLYSTLGFLDAKVVPGNVELSEDGSEAYVSFDITEGPRTYVHGIRTEGNTVFKDEEIIAAGLYKPGTPFNPQLEHDTVSDVLNMYSQKGYIHADMQVEKAFLDDRLHVDLVYKVKEGGQVRVGKIILRGNEDTKDSLIMHELLIKPGDPYDYEKVLRSQRRLYRRGFFSKARIEPLEPDKVEPVKDLIVKLKERDAGAVEFGVGYGDFDRYRGFAEISYSNLFGLAHRISARGEMSTKEIKTILGYKWPWFMDYDLDFRGNLVYLDAQKVNYDIKDFIVSAGFDKQFGEHLTASIEYKYEKLDLNAPAGAVLSPEDRNKSNLASISPSFVLDYRDDPFNPTSGSVHGLTLKVASQILGSTSEFYKLTGQTSWFFEIYKGIVFAVSFRGGYEGLFTRDVRPPISERFFLGGASSLRGYDVDTVSPKGPDGTPTGGDAMFLGNFEFRFPLPYDFGFVTFVDAGNVWLIDGDSRVRTGSTGMVYTAGAGLRYETPVGPLRLDYGWRLNPLPGDEGGEFHFTLGHAF